VSGKSKWKRRERGHGRTRVSLICQWVQRGAVRESVREEDNKIGKRHVMKKQFEAC
jgi:hypothetical protein